MTGYFNVASAGRLGEFFARTMVLALAICQAIIWFEPTNAQASAIEHLAVPLSSLALLAAILALLSRAWMVIAVAMGLFLTLSWPAYQRTVVPTIDGERLRVVSINLWARAPVGESTLGMLMASEADIIGLVEASNDWRVKLAPLIEHYPYRVECVQIDRRCQAMLLSRLPVRQHFGGRIDGAMPMVAGAEIEWLGRRFAVLVTHLTRPFAPAQPNADLAPLAGSVPLADQTAQFANLARFSNALSGDLVVMSDLNAVPWSRALTAFRRATNLSNHGPSVATWPSWLPWPFSLPIDHVLTRGHPVVVRSRALNGSESDHRAIEAEIAWRQ